jgi:RHS repeat-associated protein
MERNVKAKSLIAGFGIVLAILVCARQSAAQAAPGVFADTNNPAGPPDPEKLDQIWQVDPITGSVSITIPFTTTPASGRGPKIPFSLHYNSASTVTLQGTSNLSTFTWSTGSWGPTSGPVGPWTTSGPFFYKSVSHIPDQNPSYTIGTTIIWGTPLSGCWINGPFIYTDVSGAAHDMNLESDAISYNYTNIQPQCTVPYGVNITSSSTSDGSALETSMGSSEYVVQPDGTNASGSTLEDSNGNLASLNASGNTWTATDSLGRTAFTTNFPINYPGQIPVGSYTVTTSGATGSAETYTVNFGTATIGSCNPNEPSTSFCMPHPVGGSPNVAEISNKGVVCVASVNCPSDSNPYGIQYAGSGTAGSILPVLNSVTLPDQTGYTFNYDPTYGTISQIFFPTGGYVRFVWGIRGDGGTSGLFKLHSTIVVKDVCTSTSRSTDYGSENCWQYNFPSYSSTTGLTSTVTAPDGSYTQYTGVSLSYTGLPFFQQGESLSWKEASRLEYSSSGTLMKSVATTYYGSGVNTGLLYNVATTLYDGPTPLQQYVQYFRDAYTNVFEKDESDFNPCTGSPCPMPTNPSFLRKTLTTFAYTSNSAMATAYIVNKPSQVLVTDGSGNPYSLDNYGYDSLGKGNLLLESKCISISGTGSAATCASTASTWQTQYTYDTTGQMTQKIEGYGSPKPATTKYTWGGLNNGFLLSVQYPDLTTEQFTYWQPIGAVASHTDVNGNTTNYTYADSLNRITLIQLPATPDGTTGSSARGTTTYTYNDAAGAFSVQEQHLITGSSSTSVKKYYDGLGRAVTSSTAVPTSQCSTGSILVYTTYDSMSRVNTTTNPYCTTSDTTYGTTYFSYDALGRKTDTTLPDGSISHIDYAGNATETTDPPNGTTNVQHIQQVNGLGQLTSVCEVGLAPQSIGGLQSCNLNIAGSGSLTTYAYDPLGNMLNVIQHGLARTFTYDNLSRLTSALNPEVGTDTYTYSSSGSACSPSADAPCTRTDARGVLTTYLYDNMSRLTSKSYSAASGNTTGGVSDLTSCYLYGLTKDTNNFTGGRLIAEWMQPPGTCSTTIPTTSSAIGVRKHPTYDAMGRLLIDQQCLTGASCSTTTGKFVYSYNLLGNPVQSNNGIFTATVPATQLAPSNQTSGNGTPITAPSITWRTTYDIAGHILQAYVQDQPGTAVFPAGTYSFAPTLINPIAYDAFSHMTAANVGVPYGGSNGAIQISRQYDNRGRLSSEVDGGQTDTSSATSSFGLISIGGTEQAHYSTQTTYASATLAVIGSDGSHQVNVQNCVYNPYYCWWVPTTVPDTGTLNVTINGFTSTASFGSTDTDTTIVNQLVQGFGTANNPVSGSPVTATANRTSFTVTAKAAGPSGNYPITLSSGTDFVATDATASLIGGHQGGCIAYDKGTISATIKGTLSNPFSYTASASWARGDTAASMATKLASQINSVAGSVVNATPYTSNASYITLMSTTPGANTDYLVSVATKDAQAQYTYFYTDPSFVAGAEDMTGGTSAQASQYGTIYSYEAGYAPNGNILVHSDSVMGTWNFSYDAMDRLATAVAGPSAPSAFRNQSAAWSYDSFGNRTAQTFSGGSYSNWANYNPANNRIATASTAPGGYVYDASGNTLNDGNNKYWYDAEGQLCAQQNQVSGIVTQYVYDAEGARIAKTNLSAAPPNSTSLCAQPLSSGYTLTARYLVDLGGDQVTELNTTSGALAWAHSNVFSAARLTATYDYHGGNGGLHYELADPLGTKRVQANISGVIEESCISLPYGDALSCTGSDDATEHHFTGKERDTESGNDYFDARYYASAMGRFLSPDPLLNSGRPDNPQTWNRYAYVLNNPLNATDPTGLYNLPSNCSDDKTCSGTAANLKSGVTALTAAVNKLSDDDPRKATLQTSLTALGTENDGNNVNVQFGKTSDGSAAQTVPGADSSGKLNFTLTFDPSKNKGLDMAINAAHEGTHVADYSDPRYNTNTLSPFSMEYRGYRTSAYAASALGQPSLSFKGQDGRGSYPIWNGSWGAVDKNITSYLTGLRDKTTGQQTHPETTPHDPWSK